VHKALLLVLAQLCSVGGMAWLALAMEQHRQQVRGTLDAAAQTPVKRIRALGVGALLLSLGFCLGADHASMAVLVWLMSLSAAAMLLAFVLAWRPRWLSWLLPHRPRA